MEPLAVNIREAARLTSLSPHTIRWYARTGRIRSVRCGRRILSTSRNWVRLLDVE